MDLNPDELLPDELLFSSRLNGSSVKGSYSTFQFVLRLRDDVRSSLQKGEFNEEAIRANSTSIHENIHWWQHIGSNLGFLFSLAGPAFATACFDELNALVKNGLNYKSLKKFDKIYVEKYNKADIEELNFILNRQYHE